MMRLPRFQYLAPRDLSEAARLLSDHGPEAQVVAGGTDLWPNMKRRQQTPRRVIGLRKIERLFKKSNDGRGALTLGAMTSLTRVENDPDVAAAWPALAQAARLISTPPLRNMGTLGGNLCLDTRCNYYDQNYEWRKAIDFCMKKDGRICWVAPGSDRCWAVASSDTAPVLMAIGAEVTLVSSAGERRIPVGELFHDDGIRYLTKRPDEILTEIHLPSPDAADAGDAGGGRARAVYRKLRRRDSFDFPVLGVAASARFAADGTVQAARVIITGTGSRPHAAAVDKLLGITIDDNVIREFAAGAARIAKPLDNTDFVHGWRKEMAKRLIADALRELIRPS
jgi:4-hydroxybenzoyl-CoA reductase subunit beta